MSNPRDILTVDVAELSDGAAAEVREQVERHRAERAARFPAQRRPILSGAEYHRAEKDAEPVDSVPVRPTVPLPGDVEMSAVVDGRRHVVASTAEES